MRAQAMEWFKNLNAKRGAALVVAPGLLAVGADAAISHFAGKEMHHPAQLVPVVFAPLACAALTAFAAPRLTALRFRRAVRWIGALGGAVGMAGTTFHLLALRKLMEGQPPTLAALTAALAVAPPLFAPGAFAMIGGIVWLLGNPKLELHFTVPALRGMAVRAA